MLANNRRWSEEGGGFRRDLGDSKLASKQRLREFSFKTAETSRRLWSSLTPASQRGHAAAAANPCLVDFQPSALLLNSPPSSSPAWRMCWTGTPQPPSDPARSSACVGRPPWRPALWRTVNRGDGKLKTATRAPWWTWQHSRRRLLSSE